ELQDLTIIIDGYNYIQNIGLECLARVFPQLQNLKKLHIQIAQPNRYDEIGVIAICERIKFLNSQIFQNQILMEEKLTSLEFKQQFPYLNHQQIFIIWILNLAIYQDKFMEIRNWELVQDHQLTQHFQVFLYFKKIQLTQIKKWS
ncbi:hypothetical protein ABPG72_020468, partial [Tetrahymena utriculariae]